MTSMRFVALALVLACGDAPDAAYVIDTLPNGAERIRNVGMVDSTFSDSGAIRLVLEHRIAPPEGSPGALRLPMHVVVDDSGRIVVFDFGPAELKLFGSDGVYLHSIGREGSGPQEYRNRILLWLVGDTIALSDMANGRMQLFRRDGSVVRSFPAPCCYNLRSPSMTGGIIPVGTSVRPGSGGSFMDGFGWIRFRTDGSVVDTVMAPFQADHRVWRITTPRGEFPHPIPFTPTRQFALDPDGTMVYGADNGLSLVYSRTGADTMRLVELPTIQPVPLGDSMRAQMLESNRAYAASIGGQLQGELSDIPTIMPLWHAVEVDPTGRTWVRIAGGYLVLDKAGRFLAQVRLAGDDEITTYWSKDRMARITFDAEDRPVIDVYRVEAREQS